MPPKQARSLGPLAGRTFSPSAAPTTPSPASSKIKLNASATATNGSSSPRGPGSSPFASSSTTPDGPSPFLIPREEETTEHRELRKALKKFVEAYHNWKAAVDLTAIHVGSYCEALGELEGQLVAAETVSKAASRKVRPRRGEKELLEVLGLDQGASNVGIVETLWHLDDYYGSIDSGKQRIVTAENSLLKLKDQLQGHEMEWSRRDVVVSWRTISGKDFVAATSQLTLQAQLQTLQLWSTLDELFTTCSPLGSLYWSSTSSTEMDRQSNRSMYDPKTSANRKEKILQIWNELPELEQTGKGCISWWEEVMTSEIGRWMEQD